MQTEVQDLLQSFPELAGELPMVKEEKLEYVANERFAGLADAGELKLVEVDELLKEYRELVGVLRKRGMLA